MNFKKYMLLTSCLVSLNAANAGGFEDVIDDLNKNAHAGVNYKTSYHDIKLTSTQHDLHDEFDTNLGHPSRDYTLIATHNAGVLLYELTGSFWDTPPEGNTTHEPINILWSIRSPRVDKGLNTSAMAKEEAAVDQKRETALLSLERVITSLQQRAAGHVFFTSEFPAPLHLRMRELKIRMLRPRPGFEIVTSDNVITPFDIKQFVRELPKSSSSSTSAVSAEQVAAEERERVRIKEEEQQRALDQAEAQPMAAAAATPTQ